MSANRSVEMLAQNRIVSTLGLSIRRFLNGGSQGMEYLKPSLLPVPLNNNDSSINDSGSGSGSVAEWIWNGILLAVPKKKTTHRKKRSRLLGPHSMKSAQPLNHLNRCHSCGHYKRANTLCIYCVDQIRYLWKNHLDANGDKDATTHLSSYENLNKIDQRIIYPGKTDKPELEKLKDKDSYLKKKIRTLPVEGKN